MPDRYVATLLLLPSDGMRQVTRGPGRDDVGRVEDTIKVIHGDRFEGRKRAEVPQALGIIVYTYDSYLQAAFRSLRHLLTEAADASTDLDHAFSYDRIDELRGRYATARSRATFTNKRDHSNFEGDRSNLEGDRGKNSRARAGEAAVPTKS
ncbi:MAG TPA: hypothetical protein VFD67_09140 [Gemmatimonadaceae bacterium]|nr:hypothetical protein [Gemmatimonadaceae bacterium]